MAKENKEKSRSWKTVYRFAIIDDKSHKNLFVFKGTRLALILISSVSILALFGIIIAIIAYTPIKQVIPGYPSPETRRIAIQNAAKVDSLEREVQLWNLQLTNIQRVVTGKEPLKIDSLLNSGRNVYPESPTNKGRSPEDSILREEVMQREKFDLSSSKGNVSQIEGMLFFTPVKGIISQAFDKSIGHPYIDIATPSNSIVSSVLDGTIISASWSDETGYIIQIQHSNDIISIYKHNVKLLKQTGDRVNAGTPISLVGDVGSLSTGSHLHFELWYKGEPVDPSEYIKF